MADWREELAKLLQREPEELQLISSTGPLSEQRLDLAIVEVRITKQQRPTYRPREHAAASRTSRTRNVVAPPKALQPEQQEKL